MKVSVPVAVRLGADELAKLDAVVEVLATRNPDLRPTRSDALRHLVSRSATVLQGAVTGMSAPRPPLPGEHNQAA